jgi:DNA repair protein RadC
MALTEGIQGLPTTHDAPMLIKDLPPNARPREKMLLLGASALSNAELLALLIRTGTPGRNALQIGQELLERFDGVSGLLHAGSEALVAIKGLGPAKRAELGAVIELARRALAEELRDRRLFSNEKEVSDYLRMQLGSRTYEVFAVMFLDSQQRLITWEELFRGSLSQTSVYPREVVVRALALNASAVVLAHNHPSGCAQPSMADQQLTRVLQAALNLVDIRVLDHFVVTADQTVSLAGLGML